MNKKDCYKILALSEDESIEKVKNSYRQLSKLYHPDLCQLGKEHCSHMFHLINESYNSIINNKFNEEEAVSFREYQQYIQKIQQQKQTVNQNNYDNQQQYANYNTGQNYHGQQYYNNQQQAMLAQQQYAQQQYMQQQYAQQLKIQQQYFKQQLLIQEEQKKFDRIRQMNLENRFRQKDNEYLMLKNKIIKQGTIFQNEFEKLNQQINSNKQKELLKTQKWMELQKQKNSIENLQKSENVQKFSKNLGKENEQKQNINKIEKPVEIKNKQQLDIAKINDDYNKQTSQIKGEKTTTISWVNQRIGKKIKKENTKQKSKFWPIFLGVVSFFIITLATLILLLMFVF